MSKRFHMLGTSRLWSAASNSGCWCSCCFWCGRYPPSRKFCLVVRVIRVKDGFACEGSDVFARNVKHRVTHHTDVVDAVFWDGTHTCALHLYNFPADFDTRYGGCVLLEVWPVPAHAFWYDTTALPAARARR